LIPHAGFTELKQVFLGAASRGAGLGKTLLTALETEAMDAGATLLRLEVGTRQHAAISLYRRAGYVEIDPFGNYRAQPTSLFMQKRLQPRPPATPA
jgi:putative acetyltransferase